MEGTSEGKLDGKIDDAGAVGLITGDGVAAQY